MFQNQLFVLFFENESDKIMNKMETLMIAVITTLEKSMKKGKLGIIKLMEFIISALLISLYMKEGKVSRKINELIRSGFGFL